LCVDRPKERVSGDGHHYDTVATSDVYAIPVVAAPVSKRAVSVREAEGGPGEYRRVACYSPTRASASATMPSDKYRPLPI